MERDEPQSLVGNYNAKCQMAQHNGYPLSMLKNPILLKLPNMLWIGKGTCICMVGLMHTVQVRLHHQKGAIMVLEIHT